MDKLWPSRGAVAGVIIYRLVNACVLQTHFVPDEYWQSLEVAHRLVFGFGHLTWEWKEGIRGYAHPLLFALVYWLLKLFGLDSSFALGFCPRLVMGLFAALSDLCVYRLTAGYLESPSAATWAVSIDFLFLMPMLCSLTSWFSFYCMPRTLANSLEAALITVTLSIWFTSSSLRSSKCVWVCFSIGALSVLIRPTSAVVWLVVFGTHLVAATNKLDFILLHVLPVAVIAAFVSVALDSYFYGKFVVALWNFFKFNVLYDLGSLFGTHPWHWYLSQGIPVVFGTHLPLCLLGVVNVPSRRLLLFVVMCCYVVIHSLLSHKEFRFMVPLLPLAAVYAGHFCSTISGKWRTTVLVSLIVFNTPVAVYTSLIHQRGTLSVMRYLDGLMDSLDVDYVGEDDRFYGDPVNWLNESYSHEKELPSHIVIYDLLEKELELLFGYKKYSKVEVFFHTHFHEKRIGQTVIVYRRWSH